MSILFLFLGFYMPTVFKCKAFRKDKSTCIPIVSLLLKVTAHPFIFGLKPYTDANTNKKVALTERRDLVFTHWCVYRVYKLPNTILLDTYVLLKEPDLLVMWPNAAKADGISGAQKWIHQSTFTRTWISFKINSCTLWFDQSMYFRSCHHQIILVIWIGISYLMIKC